jgi:integrase
MESVLLDIAGHRRSPATVPGYHRGRPPRNKGEQYPADPPTVEEIVAVMRSVGDRPDGHRLRALFVLLWRVGLRISEALALQESDLDRCRGAVVVRRDIRRQAPRGRDGPLGMGAARPVARDPTRTADRRAAVRDPRTDRRPAMGGVGRTQTAAPHGRRSWS